MNRDDLGLLLEMLQAEAQQTTMYLTSAQRVGRAG